MILTFMVCLHLSRAHRLPMFETVGLTSAIQRSRSVTSWNGFHHSISNKGTTTLSARDGLRRGNGCWSQVNLSGGFRERLIRQGSYAVMGGVCYTQTIRKQPRLYADEIHSWGWENLSCVCLCERMSYKRIRMC